MWKIREIRFLGVIIGSDRVKMKKKKVQEVVDWLVQRIVKDVQKFLGLANYYRQFVKDFTRVAKPLYEIMRKDVKQNQRKRQQRVFEKLKKRFTMELVLVTSDLDKEMRVETDVLNFATGEVLLMKCEDEKQRPVAYILKLLNKAEKNYKIYDKEILAIIRCLKA